MTVDLRHLRAFLAIAEQGNLTRAAAALHTSQPAVSRTLRQLEAHLGVRLVDRSTHHVRLTGSGRAFQLRAATAVAAVDAALDAGGLGAGGLGAWPVRLGHAWSALGRPTARALRRWRQRHPDAPLELLRFDDRSAGLADGRVDAALLRGPVRVPGARSVWLGDEPRLAALPQDSALAERAAVTLAELAEQPVVLNTVSGTTAVGLWPASHRPSIALEVGNTDDWLAAVAAGRGVGVTTTATAELHSHPGVSYRPVRDAAAVPLHLAWGEPPSHPLVPELADFLRPFTDRAAAAGGA